MPASFKYYQKSRNEFNNEFNNEQFRNDRSITYTIPHSKTSILDIETSQAKEIYDIKSSKDDMFINNNNHNNKKIKKENKNNTNNKKNKKNKNKKKKDFSKKSQSVQFLGPLANMFAKMSEQAAEMSEDETKLYFNLLFLF